MGCGIGVTCSKKKVLILNFEIGYNYCVCTVW